MEKKKARARKKVAKKSRTTKDIASTYNRYKLYKGKQYTGVTIGRGHKWYYDKGIWLDKKISPEKWTINFEVTKRRAGKAPEGSGAPVGTEYHWFILAHQVVKKLDANSYSTAMNGVKYKLAHKRIAKEKWSISDKTQRNHLIKILKGYIEELETTAAEEFETKAQKATEKKTPAKKAVKQTQTAPKSVKKKELEEA
jgi:hypothetical protein